MHASEEDMQPPIGEERNRRGLLQPCRMPMTRLYHRLFFGQVKCCRDVAKSIEICAYLATPSAVLGAPLVASYVVAQTARSIVRLVNRHGKWGGGACGVAGKGRHVRPRSLHDPD
jgi:hypothetical protein